MLCECLTDKECPPYTHKCVCSLFIDQSKCKAKNHRCLCHNKLYPFCRTLIHYGSCDCNVLCRSNTHICVCDNRIDVDNHCGSKKHVCICHKVFSVSTSCKAIVHRGYWNKLYKLFELNIFSS